jgi:hypothetical protein
MAATLGRGNAKQQRMQVSKKARQQVLVVVADRADEDENAGGTSDDDWLPEQVPSATAGGSQQVAKVVYKVSCFTEFEMPKSHHATKM